MAGLLALQICSLDFGVSTMQAAATIAACVAAEALLARLAGRSPDLRSPFITGCSLSLLLRTHDPLVWIGAGAIAVGSKYLLRCRGKHVFNPACFAIVTLLLLSGDVWISPAIWGSAIWFAFLLAGLGALVLTRASRVDTALAFLACTGALLVARCLALGDPLTIPWHQMQSGALLLFGLFMVTDPRSTPNSRVGRLVFACTVAVLAHVLQFGWQVRPGLFYALVLAAPLTPVLDVCLPAACFRWPSTMEPRPCA